MILSYLSTCLFLSLCFFNLQSSKKHLPSNYLDDLISHDDTIHSPFVNDEPRLDRCDKPAQYTQGRRKVFDKFEGPRIEMTSVSAFM